MELKNQYFKKVLKLFVILFFFYVVFRLNVSHFFELKANEKENIPELSRQEKILQNTHIGILFKNEQKNMAIFILPTNNWIYDISAFVSEYTVSKKLTGQNLQENTLYLSKLDTDCITGNDCGQDFEQIIELAKKYEMSPKTYDLTKNIILREVNDGN